MQLTYSGAEDAAELRVLVHGSVGGGRGAGPTHAHVLLKLVAVGAELPVTLRFPPLPPCSLLCINLYIKQR